jgi:hypothetical protein
VQDYPWRQKGFSRAMQDAGVGVDGVGGRGGRPQQADRCASSPFQRSGVCAVGALSPSLPVESGWLGNRRDLTPSSCQARPMSRLIAKAERS